MNPPKRQFDVACPTDELAIICEYEKPVYIMQREKGFVPGLGDWHVRDMKGRLVGVNEYRADLLERLEYGKIA